MGQNSSKVSAQDKAILQLKIQRDSLNQAQKRMQQVADKEQQLARTLLAKGDKNKAKLALKRKKYQEGLLAKIDEQLTSLSQLASGIEFALVQKDVLLGLQEGNKALQQLNKEMPIDKVEKIMDDSREGIAYQEELSSKLAESLSEQDMDEVEDELQALIEAENKKSLVGELPSVPKTRVESAGVEEEEEEKPQKSSERQPVLA